MASRKNHISIGPPADPREKGLLSEEEYKQKREEIIKSI